MFVQHYKDRFNKDHCLLEHITPQTPQRILSEEARSWLDKYFTGKEIKRTVISLDRYRPPGLDGYTAAFYTDNWPII